MAVNPLTGIPDDYVAPEDTEDQIIPLRPKEIGDDNPLRVEDLVAWLETMDPLKPVRIVMKTRDSRTDSDIHMITENFGEDATVDILPMKMPKDYKDLRQLLAEKANNLSEEVLGDREAHKTDDEECDEAQIILDAIRKRKKMRAVADADRVATELAEAAKAGVDLIQYREMVKQKEQDRRQKANRRRERLRGAE